jgi:hypothetical protein
MEELVAKGLRIDRIVKTFADKRLSRRDASRLIAEIRDRQTNQPIQEATMRRCPRCRNQSTLWSRNYPGVCFACDVRYRARVKRSRVV